MGLRISGHKTLAMVERYCHWNGTYKKVPGAMLKLVAPVTPFWYTIWDGEFGGGPERSVMLKAAVSRAMQSSE